MEEKALELCAKVFGKPASELSLDTRMVEDLNISSMNAFMLAGQVKKQYGLKMDYKVARNFETIGAFAAYLEENVK